MLANLDIFFVSAFTVELAVNAYATWFNHFRRNYWNWFDLAIVSISLVGLLPAGIPLRFALVLRCCRVLRIFGKIKSVRRIFFALSYAIMQL